MLFPLDEARLAVAMHEVLMKSGGKQMITGYNIGPLVVTEAALIYFKEHSKLALNDERLLRLPKKFRAIVVNFYYYQHWLSECRTDVEALLGTSSTLGTGRGLCYQSTCKAFHFQKCVISTGTPNS